MKRSFKDCFCHGDCEQAKKYAILVKEIYKVDRYVPIRILLEISTPQIYKSTCGKFGSISDINQVQLTLRFMATRRKPAKVSFAKVMRERKLGRQAVEVSYGHM